VCHDDKVSQDGTLVELSAKLYTTSMQIRHDKLVFIDHRGFPIA
jgi:hypothetical protein